MISAALLVSQAKAVTINSLFGVHLRPIQVVQVPTMLLHEAQEHQATAGVMQVAQTGLGVVLLALSESILMALDASIKAAPFQPSPPVMGFVLFGTELKDGGDTFQPFRVE